MGKVSFKKLNKEDIELVRQWRNSPEIASYMYTEEHITKEQQEKWFEKLNHDTAAHWIIEYNSKKMGLVSLSDINKVHKWCYWAFYLGDTSVRGAGIGGKVEYNILEYVFNDLGLNKLRCEVLTSNEKVINMHEKFGFRREAYYREHCIKGKNKLDSVGLAILKSEWEKIQPIMEKKIFGEK